MLNYFIQFLKDLFNLSDVNKFNHDLSKAIQLRFDLLEKKNFRYFIIILIIEIIGFFLVYGCLESGFHWKYLFQI